MTLGLYGEPTINQAHTMAQEWLADHEGVRK